ncbi:MAG: DUF447 family protein [Burkholderiales bacterium]|nr:DUF447 family protein [Burkholderiales bacterium]
MIFETVVTTCAADGAVHIAPMGIREEAGIVVLSPFRPSTTLDNIEATRCAVVNIVDDVRIFAGCLTGRRDWPVVPCDAVPGVRLRAALGHRELRLSRIEDDGQRPRLHCTIVAEHTHRAFRGFNRAQAAVVEAAVLVSRLHLLPRDKIEREFEYLAIAIDKTAGPHEREAWEWLLATVESFFAASRTPVR